MSSRPPRAALSSSSVRRAAAAPESPPGLPSAAWAAALRRSLGRWFGAHGRDLPWRRRRDPYAVWVSEVMLQQTTVATVGPRFEQFLAAFPTLESLAAADEQEVLKQWEGLGYYRRARQLHRCAQVVVQAHGGQLPADLEALRGLPGIGRYTAGAILSIAFDRPAPILEANTQRVYSRLLGYEGDPASTAGQRFLWAVAEAVLPAQRGSSRLNQALMDLGSLLCAPRTPQCAACPVERLCAARQQGKEHVLPRLKARAVFEQCREVGLVVWRGTRVLLRQRMAGERWAGLWDFPRYPVSGDDAAEHRLQALAALHAQTGLAVDVGDRITTIKHGVTRFRITLDCYQATVAAGNGRRPAKERTDVRWLTPAELEQYPLSTTGRKIARLLAERRRAGR